MRPGDLRARSPRSSSGGSSHYLGIETPSGWGHRPDFPGVRWRIDRPRGGAAPSLDEHGLQVSAGVVQGSGQPRQRRRHRVTPRLPSHVSGHEEEMRRHHLPSLAGGRRSARLATLRTMAWTATGTSHIRGSPPSPRSLPPRQRVPPRRLTAPDARARRAASKSSRAASTAARTAAGESLSFIYPLTRQVSMTGSTQPFRGAVLEGLIPGKATDDAKWL